MSTSRTIEQALTSARAQLEPHSSSAASDTLVLLASILKQDKAWILAHPESELTPTTQSEFENSLARLRTGEPLPYVLGAWEFYGRRFIVSPAVLIPRPETEMLVEYSLLFLDSLDHPARVVDVGTGSGCIAITLVAERPNLRCTAVDSSSGALRVAKENAILHAVQKRTDWLRADLLGPVQTQFDLVIANLPYIPSDRLEDLAVAAREPREALDGGVAGLTEIRRLIQQLPDRLHPEGMALFEIDTSHGRNVVKLLESEFPSAEILVKPDLAGHDRYVAMRRKAEV